LIKIKIKIILIVASVLIVFFLGINKIRTFPESALLDGIKMGAAAKVAYLIEKGFDANQRDEKTWTPLMIAADLGFMDTVKVLLKSGADMNAVNESGWPTLNVFGHKWS